MTLRALRDTGNTLRDPVSGETVVVGGNAAVLRRLLPSEDISREDLADPASLLPLLTRRYPAAKFRLVPFRAVGVEAGLLLAMRCRCGGRDVLVAFSPSEVGGGGPYEALLGGVST